MGCITTMTYDELDRPLTKTHSAALDSQSHPLCVGRTTNLQNKNVTYSYDTYPTNDPDNPLTPSASIGHLTKVSDATGYVILKYDRRGRITEQVRQITDVETSKNLGKYYTLWSYNPDDSVKQMVYPNRETVNFVYDAHGRSYSVSGKTGTPDTTIYANDYLFDHLGRLKQVVFPSATNPITLTNAYADWSVKGAGGKTSNTTAQYTTIKNAQSVTVKILDLSYTYDWLGNILIAKDQSDPSVASNETMTYTYDALNRVYSAIQSVP